MRIAVRDADDHSVSTLEHGGVHGDVGSVDNGETLDVACALDNGAEAVLLPTGVLHTGDDTALREFHREFRRDRHTREDWDVVGVALGYEHLTLRRLLLHHVRERAQIPDVLSGELKRGLGKEDDLKTRRTSRSERSASRSGTIPIVSVRITALMSNVPIVRRSLPALQDSDDLERAKPLTQSGRPTLSSEASSSSAGTMSSDPKPSS